MGDLIKDRWSSELDQDDDEDQEASEDDGNDEDDEDDEAYLYPEYDEDDEGDNYSDYGEHPWLETIRGTAAPPRSTPLSLKDSKIGSCLARLIRRGQMRASFWLEMEEPSQETADLAFELFDRYGRLQTDYYNHDILKGTGAWGEELNHGDLLLFEENRSTNNGEDKV